MTTTSSGLGFLARACALQGELSGRYPSALWRDGEAASRGLSVLEEVLARYEGVLNLTGDVAKLWSQVEEALLTCAVLAVLCEAAQVAEDGVKRAYGGISAGGADASRDANRAHEAGGMTGTERSDARMWRVLDVGSGGGFPGLVIAACTVAHLELVEPRAKRVAFLDVALRMIRAETGGDAQAFVWRGRIEGGRYRGEGIGPRVGSFDAASARAVFAPSSWLGEAAPWLLPHGAVLLHQHGGDGLPAGFEPIVQVERGDWSVRAVKNRADVER